MQDNRDTESELMARVAAGDIQAYEQVYNRYYLGVFRFASGFLEDRQAAEDITAETFIKLWDLRSNIPAIRSVSAFLFTTVKHACLNYLRNKKRHDAHHEQIARLLAAETEDSLAVHEVTETVFRYLETEINKLSPRQRVVMQLHLQGKKHEEISLALGISEKTVRNLKSEAVKILRNILIEKELFALFMLYITVFRQD